MASVAATETVGWAGVGLQLTVTVTLAPLIVPLALPSVQVIALGCW